MWFFLMFFDGNVAVGGQRVKTRNVTISALKMAKNDTPELLQLKIIKTPPAVLAQNLCKTRCNSLRFDLHPAKAWQLHSARDAWSDGFIVHFERHLQKHLITSFTFYGVKAQATHGRSHVEGLLVMIACSNRAVDCALKHLLPQMAARITPPS